MRESDTDSITSVILELLRNIPDSPQLILKQLRELHWKEYEKYYVLTIDKRYRKTALLDHRKLQDILHTPLFKYKNYTIAILGCKHYENLNIEKYNQILSNYSLFGGLSHGFFDITKLSIFFHQSVRAIELNMHYGYNCMLSRYEDLMISHLIDFGVRNNEKEFLYYCHPNVLEIYEYDQTHDTDYLNTLAAYIFANMSPRKAAKTLYIHPNTMYNRITRLKENFHIQFDDLGMLSKITLSIHVMGYMNHIDRKLWDEIYRPL